MDSTIKTHLETVKHHLYINPLEKCNLKCKICYTRKTDPILSEERIQEFVSRYQRVCKIQTITFCGGEVFALKYFPHLVNSLTKQGIFVQVITNGTIDTLFLFTKPNFINLIVSLDGLETYHDANRGKGNFHKSTTFLQKAQQAGFHTEIFSIVTKQNMPMIDSFETYFYQKLGKINITYHPRKPPEYLMHHPVSNIVGEVNGFDFLSKEEMLTIMKTRNVFPPKNLGCYQIALVSDGRVFGCCEGVTSIGRMEDTIEELFARLDDRIKSWYKTNTLKNCLGCSQPEFMCGIKQYLHMVETN